MGVTKLKPSRTPRLLDHWAEEKEELRKGAARDAQNAIENSKRLVAQSKEIQANLNAIACQKRLPGARLVRDFKIL
jgi:hypothetical protein